MEIIATKKDTAQFHLTLGSFDTWSSVETTNKETKEGQTECLFYDVDTYPVVVNTDTTVFKQPVKHQMTTSGPWQPNIQHPIFLPLRAEKLKPREVKFDKEAEQSSGKLKHTGNQTYSEENLGFLPD